MVSHHHDKFSGNMHCCIRDMLLPHDLASSLDLKATRPYGQEPLKVSHYPENFSGNRECGDIMVLVCQAISQDHMTNGTFGGIGGSPLCQVTKLPGLVAIGSLVRRYNFLGLSGDITTPNESRAMALCRKESFKVSHHQATKLGGNRH